MASSTIRPLTQILPLMKPLSFAIERACAYREIVEALSSRSVPASKYKEGTKKFLSESSRGRRSFLDHSEGPN